MAGVHGGHDEGTEWLGGTVGLLELECLALTWLYHLLGICLWVSHFNSLNFSFLICKGCGKKGEHPFKVLSTQHATECYLWGVTIQGFDITGLSKEPLSQAEWG